MKKHNYIKLMMMLMMVVFSIGFIKTSKQVEADNELQTLKTSSGSDLTYYRSSEKVKALKEYNYPTQQFRGVWVSTFTSDIPQFKNSSQFKSDATTLLDNIQNMGFNAIIFHVRTHNNALYNSDLNPIAKYWVNVDFDVFDPLEWLITECHNRGIEFHAWMNPYRVSDNYVGEDYPEGNPCNDPSLVLGQGSSKILDPSSEVVQEFIVNTCLEFVERYDADAIHFDDYFYISGVATDLTADQKRNNVNNFIQKLSVAMHKFNDENNRCVQIGIAPTGIYRNGSYSSSPTYDENGSLLSPYGSDTGGQEHYASYLYADTKLWIDNEWIDYILPQSYWGLEHNIASFAALSRWWSWVVKYKKVNLYMAMGLYMAVSSGSSAKYWQLNEDEVKNQLLNAAMYEEIKGISVYKYSSLLLGNVSTIIANGVDLISNDYWSKKIPGAVSAQYADKIESIKVTNLTVNNNILSWDKINNVFGYMVYQVPIGEELDQNNIEQLLIYTQDNKVDNIDTLNYNYYVSSVNRANVISTPVGYGDLLLKDYEKVINYIDSLPLVINLSIEEKVNTIRERYNLLSDDDKTKVTNIKKLIDAENLIKKYKVMKSEVSYFIASVDKRINTDRVLPVIDGVKWKYKDVNDASKYNITTGKRLINYLSSYKITLILEYQKDGFTYEEDVDFDLSLLKESQVGLVYRNDLSAMSKDYVGSYTNTSKYIGWSLTTITIDKYVLFVADGNYFELNSEEIPSCNWVSCGGVYKNISNKDINITLGSAFSSETPNFGYLIIGNDNKLKRISQTSLSTDVVTLSKGETLFIIRYLDREINNNPFLNLSSLDVEMVAYVTNYQEKTISIQDKADEVIALINTLSQIITLEDEEKIKELRSTYEELDDEIKALVTNIESLVEAENIITKLKKELQDAKTNAINELTNFVELNKYSSVNQKVIEELILKGKNVILNATSVNDVSIIIEQIKNEIKLIKTISEELKVYALEQLEQLKQSIPWDNYSQKNQEKIQELINNLSTKFDEIGDNLTQIKIDEALLEVNGKINLIQTKDDELKDAKLEAEQLFYEYIENKQYSNENQKLIDQIIYDTLVLINNENDIDTLSLILIEARKKVDNIPTKEQELLNLKIEYKNNLKIVFENSVIYISGDEETLVYLNNLLDEYIYKIDVAVNKINVQNIYKEFVAELDFEILKMQAKTLIENFKLEINLALYSEVNQEFINKEITLIETLVSREVTIEEINAKINEVRTTIANIKTLEVELQDKKVELNSYLQGLSKDNLTDVQLEAYEKMISTFSIKIDKSTKIAELESLKTEIDMEYNAVITLVDTSKNSGCNCKKSFNAFIVFYSFICLVYVIKRKK